MKYIFIPVILLNIQSLIFAQKENFTYGELTPEELQLEIYEEDPEASAVVLFDIGRTKFEYKDNHGYVIKFHRHKRIKILKEEGLKESTVSIPFYVDGFGKTEYVTSVKAATYNSANQMIQRATLDESTIYEDKINENWHVKKFAMPAAKQGSIIEYEYEIESPFLFKLPEWKFQDEIPTLHSEYEVRIIPFYEYVFIAQGIKSFTKQESYVSKEKYTWGNVVKTYGTNMGSGIEFQEMVYRYVKKDVPAFYDESYISNRDDYIQKIDFQLSVYHSPRGGDEEIMTTWPNAIKELLKHDDFGKFIKASSKQARSILSDELNLDGMNESEKITTIGNYVKSNFNWNGLNGKYARQSVKDLLKSKSGNAAELNLFFTGLLNEAGITAHPVIISTRDHGKVRSDYPFLHFFNYTLVFIEGITTSLVADATDYMLPINKLPLRCLNDKGLIVREGQPGWLNMETKSPSMNKSSITMKISDEESIAKVSGSFQYTEYEAYLQKKRFEDDEQELKKKFSELGVKRIDKIKALNYDRITLPYVVALEGEVDLPRLNDKLIVKPFLNFPISKNRLTQKERSYPVDFIYEQNNELSSRIEFPSEYQLLEVPENLSYDNDLVKIKLNYDLVDNVLLVDGAYAFKKSMYSPKEYGRLRSFMIEIVDHFNKELVFQKTVQGSN